MWPSHLPEDQLDYLDGPFRTWLLGLPAKQIVGIAGNHDFVFEQMATAVDELHLPWTYLQDQSVMLNIDGEVIEIYGIPWVPNLPSWAFHAKKEDLKERYDAVPRTTDIVLSHGPPYGYGDLHAYTGKPLGCRSALDMMARVKPQAFICGHIHEAYGVYQFEHHKSDKVTDIYNVSFVDVQYNPRPFTDGSVEIVDITIDAIEEQTDPEREVCSTTADA